MSNQPTYAALQVVCPTYRDLGTFGSYSALTTTPNPQGAPMPGSTPKRGLPFPELADGPPDVAGDFQALATAVDTKLGSAGKSIIATEESRTNTAYGLLTTPDRVQGIVLPTDGLIFVAFQAMWKESVDGAAKAATSARTSSSGRRQWTPILSPRRPAAGPPRTRTSRSTQHRTAWSERTVPTRPPTTAT